MVLLICGIVGAQHVQFAQIADHAPIRGRKNESLITRFRRWVKHDTITAEAIWLPFARAVLQSLPHAPLHILLDATTAGRGCMLVMASLVYRGRAIPLLWSVVKGKICYRTEKPFAFQGTGSRSAGKRKPIGTRYPSRRA